MATFRVPGHEDFDEICNRELEQPCDESHPFRSIDGTCNNLINVFAGAINIPFKRYCVLTTKITRHRLVSSNNKN